MKYSLLFTRFPYESHYGGEEKVHLQMAEFFVQQDVSPIFLGSCPVMQKIFSGHEKKIPTYHIPFVRDITAKFSVLLSVFTLGIFFLLGIFYLGYFRVFKNTKTIICMTYIEKICWSPIAKIFGYQVFWAHHAPLGDWFYKNPYRGAWKFFSQWVTIVVPSKSMKEQLENFLGFEERHITVIYNPIEKFDITNNNKNNTGRPQGCAPTNKGLKIGTASRLSPEKNIEAVVSLAKKFPEQNFLIAGTGPEEKFLQNFAYGIENIKFLGFIEPKKMGEFFSVLDLFILPSYKEPFGLVAGEAMAQAVPVLASDIDGIAEVVGEKNISGFYFDPFAQKGNKTLAHQFEKFLKMTKKQRKKMGQAGKKRIEKNFSIENFEAELGKNFL